MDEKDWTEISHLIVGCLAVAVVVRLWQTKAKPWLADLVPSLKEEGQIALGPFDLGASDVVAAGVTALVVLVIGVTLRSSMKARKRTKKQEHEPSS